MTSSPRKVFICSAATRTSDGHDSSVGDEALTDWLAGAITNRFANTAVACVLNDRSGDGTTTTPGRVNVRPLTRLAAAIRDADLVVIGGGTMLQEDVTARFAPISGLLRFNATIAGLATAFGRPYAIANVGAEALELRRSRVAVRALVRGAQSVSTRDEASARLLLEVSGRAPFVGGDAMFLPVAAPPPTQQVVERSMCISLRPDAPSSLVDGLATTLDAPAWRDWSLTFVAMDRRMGHDQAALDRLGARLAQPERITTVPHDADWQSVYAAVAQSQLCVAMRLHCLIFAALAGRAAVALTSSPKTISFAEDVGLVSCPIDGDVAQLDGALTTASPPDAASMQRLSARAVDGLDLLSEVLA